ncbi:MAG: hypothetical protein HY287_09695 [Planctomycetes bacterium]|nr:hypothetical protein [Planctomycetota bacterium]MBI3834586.1 hypothetical protein [Planctomycetota bacterium]
MVGILASSAREAAMFEGCLWLGAVGGVSGLAILAVTFVIRQQRRRHAVLRQEFTVESLRRLKEQGKVSKQEYESIRSVLIRAQQES